MSLPPVPMNPGDVYGMSFPQRSSVGKRHVPCTYVVCESRLGFDTALLQEKKMQTILGLFQSKLDLNSKPTNALKQKQNVFCLTR